MNKPSISTEAQQIAIAGIRSNIEDAFKALQDKVDQINSEVLNDRTNDLLLLLKLRLDVLAKIEILLLKPTQEIYENLEKHFPAPGELSRAQEAISSSLQIALLQGVD